MKDKLNDTFCRTAKPSWSEEKQKYIDRRWADGGNLYLLVKPDRRKDLDPDEKPVYPKSWVFRFVDPVSGKRHDMGIGPYGPHDLTLKKARAKAGELRELLRQNINPLEHRKAELAEARKNQAKLWTFQQCAEAYIEGNKAGWKNPKHAAQWTSTLTTYCKPIWTMLVRDIEQDEVLECLEPHWKTKTETMTRVRQRIEAVLAWAKFKNLRTGDNPAKWKNHLDKALPKPTKLKKVQHRAALPYAEVGEFMAKLRKKTSLAAKALELQILTSTRPGEVVGATWDEFKLKNATITVVGDDQVAKVIKVAGLWTIPAERMKADKEHTIPLSEQAVKLLKALPRIDGSPYVFPGANPKKHMSTAAGMNLIKGTKKKKDGVMVTKVEGIWPGVTAHGFRSTFRDWAGETTAYPREVIEMAMAHQLKDKAEKAYAHGNLIAKRRNLMTDWAKYCDVVQTERGDTVVPLRGAK